jgi:hypothetical protein
LKTQHVNSGKSVQRDIWREQHPDGVEQLALDFDGGESPEQLPLV